MATHSSLLAWEIPRTGAWRAFHEDHRTVPTAQLENQDWAGVGRLSALWLSAAVYLVAAEPNPSLVFLLPCGILLAVRLPTDLASFLEDGAFNQVKPAS